jgi:hypothetical protein
MLAPLGSALKVQVLVASKKKPIYFSWINLEISTEKNVKRLHRYQSW